METFRTIISFGDATSLCSVRTETFHEITRMLSSHLRQSEGREILCRVEPQVKLGTLKNEADKRVFFSKKSPVAGWEREASFHRAEIQGALLLSR